MAKVASVHSISRVRSARRWRWRLSRPVTVAHHMLMAERRHRLDVVRAYGGEGFRWQDNHEQTSRAIALRTLARVGRRR